LENSKSKFKDCPETKKQFHLKNVSIYNKISEIIKKVDKLSAGLEDIGKKTDQPKVANQEKSVENKKNVNQL
jgi:hypothetical protein